MAMNPQSKLNTYTNVLMLTFIQSYVSAVVCSGASINKVFFPTYEEVMITLWRNMPTNKMTLLLRHIDVANIFFVDTPQRYIVTLRLQKMDNKFEEDGRTCIHRLN